MVKGTGLVGLALFTLVAVGHTMAAAQAEQPKEVREDTVNAVSEEASSALADEGGIGKGKKDKDEKASCLRGCESTYDSCVTGCKPGDDNLSCRRGCEDGWMICRSLCK